MFPVVPTRDPPHEQLLVRLGRVAWSLGRCRLVAPAIHPTSSLLAAVIVGAVDVMVVPVVPVSSCLSRHFRRPRRPLRPLLPLREQLLAAAVVVLVVVPVSSFSPLVRGRWVVISWCWDDVSRWGVGVMYQ